MFGSSKKTKKPIVSTTTVDNANELVLAIFTSLLDEDCDDPDALYMEDIVKLCEQLGIQDPSSDIRVLVMLWKLGAQSKPGCITKDEFTKGI